MSPLPHTLTCTHTHTHTEQAGCRIVSFEVDDKPVIFDRKVAASSKKFVLSEYKKNCVEVSKEVLAGAFSKAVPPLKVLIGI